MPMDSLCRRLSVCSNPVEDSRPLGKGGGVGASIPSCCPGLAAVEWTADGLLERPAFDTLWRLVGGISK